MTNYVKYKDDSKIVINNSTVEKTYSKLEPGIYSCHNLGGMFKFIPAFEEVVNRENLILFKEGIFSEVIEKVDIFFTEKVKQIYKELGVGHKLGILLYGPPGTGKTCLSKVIMKEMCDKHEVIALEASDWNVDGIQLFVSEIRKIQNNPIVLFFDEIDDTIRSREKQWLTFLDGNDSIDNCVMIGCTNYLEKIPERIRNRKSRIKFLYEVKSLPFEVYKDYIKAKLPKLSNEKIAEFAHIALEQALVIDQLKHAIIDYRIDGVPIKEAIENAKKFIEFPGDSGDNTLTIYPYNGEK